MVSEESGEALNLKYPPKGDGIHCAMQGIPLLKKTVEIFRRVVFQYWNINTI